MRISSTSAGVSTVCGVARASAVPAAPTLAPQPFRQLQDLRLRRHVREGDDLVCQDTVGAHAARWRRAEPCRGTAHAGIKPMAGPEPLHPDRRQAAKDEVRDRLARGDRGAEIVLQHPPRPRSGPVPGSARRTCIARSGARCPHRSRRGRQQHRDQFAGDEPDHNEADHRLALGRKKAMRLTRCFLRVPQMEWIGLPVAGVGPACQTQSRTPGSPGPQGWKSAPPATSAARSRSLPRAQSIARSFGAVKLGRGEARAK
jgi:hypothetical protein